jgi:hypothetical protein
VAEVAVDGGNRQPGRLQQRGGDPGAIAAPAVDPYRPARQFRQAAGQEP